MIETASPGSDGRDPGFATRVAFLRGLCGPGDEAIETHFAWVFLIGSLAYKLRKPVRRGTMDYGSLEARRRDAAEDVRLNRRLAPDVYLDAVPLVLGHGGTFAVDAPGKVVDWLVRMRRLDRSQLLDALMARHEVPAPRLAAVADLLAGFYRRAPSAWPEPETLAARLDAQCESNARALASSGLAVDLRRAAAALRERQSAWLGRHASLLADRVREGRVVECHGDLRPEHLFLGEPVCVIDCLEFDRDLRIMDAAEELAFLELECWHGGDPATGRELRAQVLDRTADAVPGQLLAFYRSHRAATRAKVYAWRAAEPDGGSPAYWYARSVNYLAAAQDAMAGATAS